MGMKLWDQMREKLIDVAVNQLDKTSVNIEKTFDKIDRNIDIISKPFVKTEEINSRTLSGNRDFDSIIEDLFSFDNYNKELEVGDVLGVNRIAYEHYGVYIGDNKVIHYSYDESANSLGKIMQCNMSDFVGRENKYFILDCKNGNKSKIKIGNNLSKLALKLLPDLMWLLDEPIHIFSPHETVTRAYSRLGEDKYNLIMNNCEHFAIWCKTGLSKSYQVEKLLKIWRKKYINY